MVAADYLGADTILTARLGRQELLVRVAGRTDIPEPQPVRLTWSPEDVHVFGTASGARLEGMQPRAVAA